MRLTEFLAPENVLFGVELSSKKRALEQIGKQVADYLNLYIPPQGEQEACCPVECFASLFKREKLGSTGINHGVALPHAKLPLNELVSLDKPIAVFLQLAEPIDYEASDHKEVDLIYAVLFPEQSCESYKGYLPEIAHKLSDKALQKRLRAAESREDLWQILQACDQQEENDGTGDN